MPLATEAVTGSQLLSPFFPCLSSFYRGSCLLPPLFFLLFPLKFALLFAASLALNLAAGLAAGLDCLAADLAAGLAAGFFWTLVDGAPKVEEMVMDIVKKVAYVDQNMPLWIEKYI